MICKRQKAFTLIEAAAVLVLIGLLASAGALSLRSACRGSQMKDVINRLTDLDQSARCLVQLSGQAGVIHIDTVKGSIRFTHDSQSHMGLRPVVLPEGFVITDVEGSPSRSSGGTIEIPCSVLGQTPAYSLSISGPKEKVRMLVFVGMTGQVIEMEHDASFDLNTILSARIDFD